MGKRFLAIRIISVLLIIIFLLKFSLNYYLIIQSSLANTLTRVIFWSVNIIGVIAIFSLFLFQKWLYINRNKILFSIGILFFGILTIEILLRTVDNKQLRFSPHQYLNYIGTPDYKSPDGLNIHNSLGFRGPEIEVPKPKDRIRIAVLGGSTTYEDFVKDWKKDFARRLEKNLQQSLKKKNIEVINAGLPGWDSWEDLINLEFRLLDLDLDLIIVYEGTNDVHARFVRPDSYKDDNSGNKKQWGKKPCFDIMCLKIVQLITGLDTYGFDIIAPTSAQFPRTNEYSPVLQMTPLEALRKNPPVYSERNLRNIVAIAKENEIDVLLATWAWSDQYNDYAASIHYQEGFRDHNNMVKKIAELKNLPVYDFASEMPKDKKYWGDGRHNNEEGVELKAKLFTNFIVKDNILKIKQN